MSRATQAKDRKSLCVQVAVSWGFWEDEMEAIGALIGREVPSRVDLRRFMSTAVRKAIQEAQKRYEEETRPEEPDIPF